MVAFNVEPDDTPSEDVLRWCENLVDMIHDGGVWGIPRSQIVFRIDKPNKKLVLTVGQPTDPDFIATRQVFAHIGWDVVAE